jgi:hypothetical protein
MGKNLSQFTWVGYFGTYYKSIADHAWARLPFERKWPRWDKDRMGGCPHFESLLSCSKVIERLTKDFTLGLSYVSLLFLSVLNKQVSSQVWIRKCQL